MAGLRPADHHNTLGNVSIRLALLLLVQLHSDNLAVKRLSDFRIQKLNHDLKPRNNQKDIHREFAEFLLLTGQSHVDVATKGSLLKRSCKSKFLQKQVKQIVKTCSTWAEVLQRLEKTFPVYESDLSVRTQIEPPMLPKYPTVARISEYVCDLEYLFSRMIVGSYGPSETAPLAGG